ncbi:MAG: outer membrane lipoprotein carrier protein LolA [Elusimicrobiaceae bacterium]|nr:outer membrane lipoprotein carrier protein LolA [Elusimicrobiaceae bacterium]
MKRSTNNISLLLLVGILAGGCSDAPEQTAVPQEQVQLPATEPTPTPVVALPNKAAVAPTHSEQNLITQFKQWDQKLRSLKTAFTQTTEYDGVLVSRSQGMLFYDKEHSLLRLDTLNEDEQVEQSAITNKQEIIILDESGKQVTTLSWTDWQQNQPNQALFDFGNYTALLNRHQVKQIKPNQLALTPKEGEMYTLYVTLSQKDVFPTEIAIESDLLVTKAVLTKIQKNTPLDEAVFGGFFK